METHLEEIQISDADRERWVSVDSLVNPGRFMTAVPSSVLRGLGIVPTDTRRVRFTEGKEARQMDIGYAWVRLERKDANLQVLFNDEGTQPVIGRMALDGLFLGFDPDTKRFTPPRRASAIILACVGG
ncbi:MAG: hypothetical protein F4X94_10485 [Dehalococcoidia bacterium]|nr:hypothetical protein [Dehalococcoidia bacterium]